MLDAHPRLERRVVPVRHVASRPDAVLADLERGVHDDPVVDLEPGRFGQCRVRQDADADDDHVGRQTLAGGGDDRGDLAVGGLKRQILTVGAALEPGHAHAEFELHAVAAMQVGEPRSDLLADHAVQRRRLGLDDGDLDPMGPGRGRDLQADPSGADDDDSATGDQAGTDLLGVPIVRR